MWLRDRLEWAPEPASCKAVASRRDFATGLMESVVPWMISIGALCSSTKATGETSR